MIYGKDKCKWKLLRNIRGHCKMANRDPGVGDHVSKIKECATHPRRQCLLRNLVADP